MNAACAVFSLMDLPSSLAKELMGYYQATAFPTDRWATPYTTPPEYKGISTYDHDNYVQTVAHSQLCHISISTFCAVNGIALGANEAGLPYLDPSKTDRCAKVCGDIAAKAAELINAHMAGTFAAEYELPAEVAACLHCHNDSSSDVNRKDISGTLDCSICHTDPTTVGRRHPFGGGGGGGGGGMF